MNDTDRILGELTEFKRAMIEEVRDLKRDVKAIAHWRWKVTGGLSVIIALAELVHVLMKQ